MYKMSIKDFLRPTLGKWTRPLRKYCRQCINESIYDRQNKHFFQKIDQTKGKKHIFYLGITEHSNLGDFGQYYCIDRWIRTYCSEYVLLKIGVNAIIQPKFHFFEKLSKCITNDDVILFQSGYTTQDLGGFHNEMHIRVAETMPNANILMMPQTIYFREEKNRQRTAKALNQCNNMLFFARDFVSFEDAIKMMPDVRTMLYPDIVTSLIGGREFHHKRDRIYLCRRNDGEKFYSEEELLVLRDNLSKLLPVDMGDTQSLASYKKIRKNLKKYIDAEIEKYSFYKVTITDRYHGTIFSLCAGTPVIILKTTDHKVTTGADWFKGVFEDGFVQVSDSLDDAYDKALAITKKDIPIKLPAYFDEKYYGKALRALFDEMFAR